jgi:hypothetical protein
VTAVGAARPTGEEAGPLVHVLCERVAQQSGSRVLAIKGPVVAMQGLRAPRTSADVDVLVHPDDLTAFVDHMRAVGWHDATETTAPRLVRSHSVNLLHDHWPVGIDVHHHFPGFLAPDAEVFDALWARRRAYVLAGARVTAADPVGMVAVVGLHLLREDAEGTSARVDDLVGRAAAVLGPEDREALLQLACETDAVVPLRPILLRLGLKRAATAESKNPTELAQWFDRAGAPPGTVWGRQLSQTPWWRWPQVLWHSMRLTDAEIATYHGGGDTRRELARARRRRLRKGFGLVPGILRGYATGRRSHPGH